MKKRNLFQSRRGTALILSLISAAVLGSLAGTAFVVIQSKYRVVHQANSWKEALLTAEGGVEIDRDLTPEEQGLDSLQLLKRGIMLIMGRDPADQAWIDGLTEEDYGRLRRHAQLHGQPLWATGFWNALSAQGVLSHRALVKLRDTGTFYHMIPENLNAAEWIVWWLRATAC